MLKGVNRNVIVVKSDRNSRFEAVYFVMKKSGYGNRTDILKEANGIIGDSGMLERQRRFSTRGASIFLGTLIGALISSVLWLIVWLAL
jgi:hypothetical protein